MKDQEAGPAMSTTPPSSRPARLAWLSPRAASRLALTAIGVELAAALVDVFILERTWAEVVEHKLEVAGGSVPPGGLTILHISDFHLRAGGFVQSRKLASVRRLVRGLDYDLVAVTGDLIHDAGGFPVALRLLDDLRPRLGAFAVPGNHDYCESSVWGVFESSWTGAGATRIGLAGRISLTIRSLWRFAGKVARNERVNEPVAYNDVPAMQAELARHGVASLVNKATCVAGDGCNVWVAGVDDLMEGRPDLASALSAVPPGALLILLAHNPDAWNEPLAARATLVLAGHTHGGQVRLPLLGAVHTQGTHLKRRQAAGWFRRGGSSMFVSQGIGESLPVRFGVRPQVALIHLIPACDDTEQKP